MSRQFSILMSLVIVTALVGPSRADDAWSLSKLNPFKKKATPATRVRASLDDRMAESRMRTATSQRQEPSTWAKMNQGTKDLFGKTKSVLMPWTNKKKSSSSSRQKSEQKTSILTSWLPKKAEPERPKSVKEFLGRPRPSF